MVSINRFLFAIWFLLLTLACKQSIAMPYESNSNDSTLYESNLVGEDLEDEVAKAHKLLEEIKQAKKFIQNLDELATVDLPVGIVSSKEKERETYAIIISDIIVRNGQAYLNAYLAFTIPGNGKKIAFKGTGIPFSYSGGIKGDAEIELVGNPEFDINKNIKLRIKGDGKTKATWDCNGFVSMTLDCDIEFDSNYFFPENEDGTRKSGSQLKTSFNTTFNDWNNILVGISLEPFQVQPVSGLGISIKNAVLDMSQFINPQHINFPPIYHKEYFGDMDPVIWQGVYIQEAEIRLPPAFKKKEKSERIKFYAQNLMIDELGLTGLLGVDNLLTLQEGDMNGWGFSVDKINIDFLASKITSASFNGQLTVPQLSEQTTLNYNATISSGDQYTFIAQLNNQINMETMAAQLTLHPNSSITVKYQDNKFIPSLLLNGMMTVNAPLQKDDPTSTKLALANLEFQGMHISSESPHLSIDYFSFGTEQNSFENFPVSINKIGFKNIQDRYGIELGLSVNFTNNKDGGIGGEGLFTIWSKKENNKWKYDGLQVDKIVVDYSKKDAFSFYGEVNFIRGDSIYGNGFKGHLDANFTGFEMEATVLFGNVKGMRYWFTDALLASKTGIPAGPLSIYGIAGGAHYRVRQTEIGANSSEIGRTTSGIVYVPDQKSGFGFMAGIKFGLSGSAEAFNGDARFGMSFTSSGGIDQIFFLGNAYFMTGAFNETVSSVADKAKKVIGKDDDIPVEASNASVYGKIHMLFDNKNKSFHASFSIFINVANGAIKGVGSGGLAGWGVIHFSPDDWYVHLGTPSNPNGVEVLDLAKLTMYFMVGNHIPEMPPPPDQVLSSLRQKGKHYSTQRNSTLDDGKGFAVGAAFSFDTGERTFLIFYGRFGCGIGFDVTIKKYGNNTHCEGMSGPIGINGWFAQGQAYAWVAASIGVKVNLFFYKGKFSLFDMEVAALLEAKLPNPFWMRGTVGGTFNILNGLVKGNCAFEFEIGKMCKIVSSSPFDGVPVIAEIKPGDQEQNLSVFTTPQIIFNMPINKEFSFRNEQRINKTYRITLKELSVKSKKGTTIKGEVNWNYEKKVATFKSKDILPGKSDIVISASVIVEEKINNAWVSVRDDKGKILVESQTITFTTGDEPDYIEQEYVELSYPLYRQYNYYKYESPDNYIQLIIGIPNLFNPGSDWKQIGRLTPVQGGSPIEFNYSYHNEENMIKFSLPRETPGNTIYRLELVNTPAVAASKMDANVQAKQTLMAHDTEDNDTEIEVETQFAVESRSELQEKVIYSMEFKTSRYESFIEKMNRLTYSEGLTWELEKNVHSLTVNIVGERFDSYEVVNLEGGTMIKTVPLLDQTKWFNEQIKPIITLDNATLSKISPPGFQPPTLTTYLFQMYGTRILTEEEILTGSTAESEVLSGMKYYLAKYSMAYLDQLKGLVALYYSRYQILDPGLEKILDTKFPPLSYGEYPVQINYTLPGKGRPSSTFQYNIKYED